VVIVGAGQQLAALLSEHGAERVAAIRGELQTTMDANASVYRTEDTLSRHCTMCRR
jgi:succinate dehydrogenase / fumarate reductase flavoprotein subunit